MPWTFDSPLAICALAVLLSSGAYTLVAFRGRGREDSVLASALRPICTVYARTIHRLRVLSDTRDPLPHEGAAILVANHRSGFDPLALAVATRRKVRFLMAREYYGALGLGWVFRRFGCIPVNRDGNDLGAMKAALKALRDGEIIGIFPQGGIREAGSSLEGKAGVALLALRSGVPVIPCYIEGSPNLESVALAILKPSRTTLVYGPPVRFGSRARKPERDELERVTGAIFDSISRQRERLDTLAEEPEADGMPPTAAKAL
jgi:1-acyl-sn-glycerol-3-phosphate acyltransferase